MGRSGGLVVHLIATGIILFLLLRCRAARHTHGFMYPLILSFRTRPVGSRRPPVEAPSTPTLPLLIPEPLNSVRARGSTTRTTLFLGPLQTPPKLVQSYPVPSAEGFAGVTGTLGWEPPRDGTHTRPGSLPETTCSIPSSVLQRHRHSEGCLRIAEEHKSADYMNQN